LKNRGEKNRQATHPY